MRKRILIITLAVTFFAILAFTVVTTQIYYNDSLNKSKSYLKVYVNAFNQKYITENGNDGAIEFSQLLNGARVTLMDLEGNVVGESASVEQSANHANREEVISAVKKGEGFSVRYSQTLKDDYVYYCQKVEVENGTLLVRVAKPTESVWDMFAHSIPTLILYLIMDIIACLIFTYAATNFIIVPIEKLARKAAYSGQLSTEYPELKPIVRILNERNLSIEKQLNQIKTEKELVVKTQNSKDEFIANVTHEMNTPLTAIKGYSELLASGMLNEEQTALAYKTIVGQSERLSNLIARIINYNELSNDDLPSYEIDLSKSVKETLNVLRVEAELRQITFIENISEGVKVFSRQERVNEVVGNLIRNAVRYNKDGGTVTITLTNNTLSVKDTGVGIAKENLDKIFSRFFTVDKSHSGKYGGFGLGLAVVKKICNISGWEIKVYSKLLEGSEFIVKFK